MQNVRIVIMDSEFCIIFTPPSAERCCLPSCIIGLPDTSVVKKGQQFFTKN